MSDLWDTCRQRLHARVSSRDWERYVQSLRAWAHDDVVYVWPEVEREPGRIPAPSPPPMLRARIDQTVREVWGRKDIRVEHGTRSPTSERITNARRAMQHRGHLAELWPAEVRAFVSHVQNALLSLAQDPTLASRLRGSADQQVYQLRALAEAEARPRVGADGWSLGNDSPPAWSRVPARRDPPPWRPAGEHDEPENAPVCACASDPRQPFPAIAPAAQASPAEPRVDGIAGPDDLKTAIARMPWWTEA